MKELILREILTFSQSELIRIGFFYCYEERGCKSFDIPELFIHGQCILVQSYDRWLWKL